MEEERGVPARLESQTLIATHGEKRNRQEEREGVVSNEKQRELLSLGVLERVEGKVTRSPARERGFGPYTGIRSQQLGQNHVKGLHGIEGFGAIKYGRLFEKG